MQNPGSGISVLEGKKRFLWRTPVLVPYENGSMLELQKQGYKTVYKVVDGPVTVILKTITCKQWEKEKISLLKS